MSLSNTVPIIQLVRNVEVDFPPRKTSICFLVMRYNISGLCWSLTFTKTVMKFAFNLELCHILGAFSESKAEGLNGMSNVISAWHIFVFVEQLLLLFMGDFLSHYGLHVVHVFVLCKNEKTFMVQN